MYTNIRLVLHGTLLWRHNGHDGVSNHQPHEWLLNRPSGRRSKKISKLRVTGLCAGIHRRPVNSPHKWPVTRKMFPLDDVIVNFKTTINWVVLGGLYRFSRQTKTSILQTYIIRNIGGVLWYGGQIKILLQCYIFIQLDISHYQPQIWVHYYLIFARWNTCKVLEQ